MDKNIIWDIYSKIISSRYRLKIFVLLSRKSLSPKQISKMTNISMSHVSRTLKELKDLNLIDCLTSADVKKGKIFCINDYGLPYIKEIHRNLDI